MELASRDLIISRTVVKPDDYAAPTHPHRRPGAVRLFGEHSSVELADRYLASVQTTCQRFAKHPMTGSPYETGLTTFRRKNDFLENPDSN
jgi:hypothetical protein